MDGNKLLAMSMASMSVTGTNLNDLNAVPENQNSEMAALIQRPTQTLH